MLNICVHHVMMRQSTHLLNINPVTVIVHMKTTICENKAKTRDHKVPHLKRSIVVKFIIFGF